MIVYEQNRWSIRSIFNKKTDVNRLQNISLQKKRLQNIEYTRQLIYIDGAPLFKISESISVLS